MTIPFDRVGQAPRSLDCGFFCGYVISLHMRAQGNLRQMLMTQADVYAARETFVGPTQNPGGPSQRWLLPDQMPAFMEGLGVPGYTAAGVAQDQDSFMNAIHDRLTRANCWGALVWLQSQRNHWVTVLRSNRNNQGALQWTMYDPAGNMNNNPNLHAAIYAATDVAQLWTTNYRISGVVT